MSTVRLAPFLAGLTLAAATQAEPARIGLDLRTELGAFTQTAQADTESALRARLRASAVAGAWEWALGGRVEAQSQQGRAEFAQQRLETDESFLRWRDSDTRITLGVQELLWGRVHELPPIDRLARVDFNRFILDSLPERRRPIPALRIERFHEGFKLDAVVSQFAPAVMPARDSAWYPIDTRVGRILGFGEVPLVVGAKVREEDPGGLGGGLRLTRTGGDFDFGVSLQRARQSLPYYKASLGLLEGSLGLLTAVHPYSWVAGGEWEAEWHGATWRFETAWSSDQPLTTRGRLRYQTDPALDWVLGMEFHPGDGDTRVNLQLAGHRTLTQLAVLDRVETYSLSGELQREFGRGLWRGELRFLTGLNEADLYVNPKLTYTGFAPHLFSVAGHLFSGAPQTPGGFYDRNDLVTAGWEVRF